MNLPAIQENNISMTSQEIAELLDVRHDSVKRSIERLVELGVINQPPLVDGEKSANHVVVKVYLFTGKQGKRDTYVVVAQLSPEFTATIVDRWQELESSQSLALPNFTDPAEAAIAWANEYKAKQALQIELKQAEPKINHYDKVVARKQTLLNATQVAQKLEKTAYWLNPHLEILKVYNGTVKRGRAFAQWFIDKGFGVMKQTDNGFSQPLFTLTGEAWVIETLTNEGIA